MNIELFYHFNTFANIVITIILLFLIVNKKGYPKKIILLIALILVTQLTSLFITMQILPILTLTLLTLLFLVLAKPDQSPNIDNSHVITQVKEQERSRIYANLHDDVGAKLLELIYNSESEKSKGLAKEVLSNIRQAVASTINIQCNNQQLAEEISQEIQARIQSLGIQLTYYSDTKTKQKLAANIPSVLSRIMREATSNIIKHAQATDVSLSILSTDKYLSLVLEDNGIGFNTDKKKGKGLKTIQKRAHSINAEVNWIQLPIQGTKFTLVYHYGNE
jgi:signal transduction histidine kinase